MTRGASAATIYSDDLHGFYEADLVLYVTLKGNFPTVVVASPFGSGTDRALLAKLHLPGCFPSTPLTLTTQQARNDGYLVLIFNPIWASNGHDACAAPASQAAAGSDGTGKMRLQAAFCYGDEVISEAIMEMPQPSDVADRGFDQAMGQLLAVLLPSDNRNQGDCGPSSTVC
jgi:hypothetical protein